MNQPLVIDRGMGAINAIMTRRSAVRLSGPGPGKLQLDAILAAGACAPDHGRLRPWRFVVIQGEDRHAFGRLLASAHARRSPGADAAALDKEAAKALRAPVIVAVAAHVTAHDRVPGLEQVLSAGAAAQNMILAAHATGFATMWKTGEPAYDPTVKQGLGLEPDDQIVGFLYIGVADKLPPMIELDLSGIVSTFPAQPD